MEPEIFLFLILGAGIFVALCLFRRELALAVIFAAIPFPNELPLGVGVNVALGELLATLWFMVELIQAFGRIRLVPTILPVLLYLGVCLASSVLDLRGAAVASFLQMVVYLVIAPALGASVTRSDREVRTALHALLLSGTFLAITGVLTREFYFFGLHKNAIGAALAASFLVSFILWENEGAGRRKKCYSLVSMMCLAGLLVNASRGAWLGAIVVAGAFLFYRRRFKLFAKFALIALIVIPLMWTLVPQERREYALDLSTTTYNVSARIKSLEFAYTKFQENPVWGAGVGLRKEYDATNLVMTVLAETGIVGSILFLLLLVSVMWVLRTSLRRCRHFPELETLAFCCAALFLAKLVHGMVDHYWSRGVVLAGWIGVGIAWRLGQIALREEMELSELDNNADIDPWAERPLHGSESVVPATRKGIA